MKRADGIRGMDGPRRFLEAGFHGRAHTDFASLNPCASRVAQQAAKASPIDTPVHRSSYALAVIRLTFPMKSLMSRKKFG